MTENKKISFVCRCLEEHFIEYEIFYHDAAFTIAECENIEKKIGSKICKNLLLTTTSGNVYYLLMLSGEKKFVTKDVSKKLGTSRLSFASPEKMRELINTEPGSLSVTSLIFDSEKAVKLAIDCDILKGEYICCHPSDNTATLKIKTKDLTEKLLPFLGTDPVIIDI
ncbi:MAG: prolyl-tRNA synthetase associated domain-containing protein [Clostridia bacterium]|nr:prolyl-tRNA synthetase associated domain-containing protein [Clostridia bacterium]